MPGDFYVGRFAPSPTGPLHFGSLVTALASYLDARANRGRWLLRMEDLDTERVRTGAADQILRDLERFGLEWDDAVVYQSQRTEAYCSAFKRLTVDGHVYPCACSRKESAGRYKGTCAAGLQKGQGARSWRLRVMDSMTIRFEDRIQGAYAQDVHAETGDFILRRADGPFAYQLAVVVDDAAQGVTHVVRGADLLDNVPRQIYLQQCLQLQTPQYAHVPVATDESGLKLSKSTGAAALDRHAPARELQHALAFLGHELPEEVQGFSVAELLAWSIRTWDVERVPRFISFRTEHPFKT